MNNEHEITQKDLETLLLDNEITDFDPVAEAFKIYDPDNTGYVDTKMLCQLFESLGVGSLSPNDLTALISLGDSDGDGKINLQDFRNMLYPPF